MGSKEKYSRITRDREERSFDVSSLNHQQGQIDDKVSMKKSNRTGTIEFFKVCLRRTCNLPRRVSNITVKII